MILNRSCTKNANDSCDIGYTFGFIAGISVASIVSLFSNGSIPLFRIVELLVIPFSTLLVYPLNKFTYKTSKVISFNYMYTFV
ncbi:hypothetical protein, partial [Thermococcus sp. GR5]|uniref:hypothetical protein n=1 Tax=Thermococcus sp. GR5 TaxID=1638255 RepID=UPI00197DC8AD